MSLHMFELDWTFYVNEILDYVEFKTANFCLSVPSPNLFDAVLVVLLYWIEEKF